MCTWQFMEFGTVPSMGSRNFRRGNQDALASEALSFGRALSPVVFHNKKTSPLRRCFITQG